MDQQQSKLVEQYQEAKLQKQLDQDDEEVNSDDDELLELLEQDDTLAKYRDERIQELKKEFNRIDNATAGEQYGNIITIEDEKQLMETVTSNEYTLVHFYQPEFDKCKKMNDKLSIIAEKHLALKVIIIKAKDAPFLVTKLGIKILPFVVIYKNGKELDRLVGFEKLGNDPNNFNIEDLENFLLLRNVINRRTINYGSIRGSIKPVDQDSDDDLDL